MAIVALPDSSCAFSGDDGTAGQFPESTGATASIFLSVESVEECRQRSFNVGNSASVPKRRSNDLVNDALVHAQIPIESRNSQRIEMNNITHVTIGTNNLEESRRFWDFVLEPVGMKRPFDLDHRSGHGIDAGVFIVIRPINGAAATSGNGGTVGLAAPDKSAVDEFHRRGLSADGSDAGAPASRPGAPHIYGAFIRDAHGHKVCAFFVGEK